MNELSHSLIQALAALRDIGPAPMRRLANRRVTSQAMANRVFRLRQLGLAQKVGPEKYEITEAGREWLNHKGRQ